MEAIIFGVVGLLGIGIFAWASHQSHKARLQEIDDYWSALEQLAKSERRSQPAKEWK